MNREQERFNDIGVCVLLCWQSEGVFLFFFAHRLILRISAQEIETKRNEMKEKGDFGGNSYQMFKIKCLFMLVIIWFG